MRKEELLSSERVYKALAMMRKGKTNFEALEISREEIDELIILGINIVHVKNNDTYYIDSSNHENNFEIISLKNYKARNVKWVEMGSLFIGHKFFDEASFRYLLQRAVDEGYTDVHLSGDITAGPPSKLNENGKYLFCDTSEEQAELVVKILSDFPSLTFYAIHGKNETDFEAHEQLNPLVLIQKDLRERNINFIYEASGTVNLIIEGIVKRVTYLTRKRAYTASYQPEFYTEEQLSKMVNNVVIKGRQYKLMFLQFGNTMENSVNKYGNKDCPVYLTTNSGFLNDKMGVLQFRTTYPSIRFCKVCIKNGKIIDEVKTKIVFKPSD